MVTETRSEPSPGAAWSVRPVRETSQPAGASNGNQTALAWAQVRVPGTLSDMQLFFSRLSDAGWSAPQALTFDAGQLDQVVRLGLDTDGRAALAWRGGNSNDSVRAGRAGNDRVGRCGCGAHEKDPGLRARDGHESG